MIAERAGQLDALAAAIRACTLCPLHETRTHAVPGEGPADAEILLIGEGPGYHEDGQGRPFVGAAGGFLEELLALAGVERGRVFITNVVKCRPPENRNPSPGELGTCVPAYLQRQIDLIDPRLIITLGRFSLALFFPGASISRLHGQSRLVDGRLVLALYHPAAALHRPDLRETLKQDVLQIPALLAQARRSPPPPQQGDEGHEPEEEPPQQLTMF